MIATSTQTLNPGSTIGLVGGGQLGRMLVMSARSMGYKVAVLAASHDDPAAQIADQVVIGSDNDSNSYVELAKHSAVITYEFENVNAEYLIEVKKQVPVHPDPEILQHLQNRALEKKLLSEANFPLAEFLVVNNQNELEQALGKIGLPAVVKTARDGYDGKGQVKVKDKNEAIGLWQKLGAKECTVERWVDLDREVSVVVARDQYGGLATYGPIENFHVNHILDISLYPAQIGEKLAQHARTLAECFVKDFNLIGLICLEFFIDQSGALLVNEIAPRPHNSGHLTIEAFSASQFDQQLRTICGLPVAEVRPLAPAAMLNLLGDVWGATEPNWSAILTDSRASLHLYGKPEARKGRKMGHVTVLGNSANEVLEHVNRIKKSLIR